jgi:hypothetical protein
MTQQLIYGKTISIQGDGFGILAPTDFQSSTVTMPHQTPAYGNLLSINNSIGASSYFSPAVTGPPVNITAAKMSLEIYWGFAQLSGNINTLYGQIAGDALNIGTLTAGTPSILIPAWLPAQIRPIFQQRIPIAGQVGPVAQPTTLVFQFETNGDVRIFKDTIGTAWNNGDTFAISVKSSFILRIV